MEEAELKRDDEFNPCMPILGAVGDKHAGDEQILALSQELAKVLFGLSGKEHAEAERLLGFAIAAVCMNGGEYRTLYAVSFYLGPVGLMYGLLEELREVGGPIGQLAKEYFNYMVEDREGFSKLRARATSPLTPFIAEPELRRLSSVMRRTFFKEAEWLEIRPRIEPVALKMMPVFDWAASKELRIQDQARAVKNGGDRYDRVRAFLIGVAGGPFEKQYDLGAGRVSWVRSADRSVLACGKAVVLGAHGTRKNVFVAAWADAGLGKVRRASRVDGVPDTACCDELEAYWLASKICAAQGCDVLDVIEEEDGVTYVGLKDVHKPGLRAWLGRAIKFLLRQRSSPAWAGTALRDKE